MKKIVLILICVLLFNSLLIFTLDKNTTKFNNDHRSIDNTEKNLNWDIDAVKYNEKCDIEKKYRPTVVFIDTGDINKELEILEYSVVPKSVQNKGSNHASIVIGKFQQLNNFSNMVYIKVSNNDTIEYKHLLKAIEKAIDIKPDIISMSIGTMRNYMKIKSIVAEAVKNNIIIIASAGNSGLDLMYPANYEGVISVMARDINNIDCFYNNKSEIKKSFSAPGEYVYVDGESISGTSIAVTYVTALVTKMITCTGKNKLSFEKIVNILKISASKSNRYSYGLIQFDRALYLTGLSNYFSKAIVY